MHQLHRDAAEKQDLVAERHRLAAELNETDEAAEAVVYSDRAYGQAAELQDLAAHMHQGAAYAHEMWEKRGGGEGLAGQDWAEAVMVFQATAG